VIYRSPFGPLHLDLGDDRLAPLVRDRLDAYFGGEPVSFDDVPLAPAGTPFQQAVWAAVREVPYGETTTYAALARRLGRPRAARAVGGANARNRVPIVVPCHRVLGSRGSLTGYAGGLAMKERLLALEVAGRRRGREAQRATQDVPDHSTSTVAPASGPVSSPDRYGAPSVPTLSSVPSDVSSITTPG
jgi:methylated-DNA-[protein]-cysteine S-methyltransferase